MLLLSDQSFVQSQFHKLTRPYNITNILNTFTLRGSIVQISYTNSIFCTNMHSSRNLQNMTKQHFLLVHCERVTSDHSYNNLYNHGTIVNWLLTRQ